MDIKQHFEQIKDRLVKNGFTYKEFKPYSKVEFFLSSRAKYKLYYDNETLHIMTKHSHVYYEFLKEVDQVNKFIEFFYYRPEFQEWMLKNKLDRPEVEM